MTSDKLVSSETRKARESETLVPREKKKLVKNNSCNYAAKGAEIGATFLPNLFSAGRESCERR